MARQINLSAPPFQLHVAHGETLKRANDGGEEDGLPSWKANPLLMFPFLLSLTVITHQQYSGYVAGHLGMKLSSYIDTLQFQ